MRDEDANKQSVNREARRAGHQRRNHDRGETVALFLDRAGRHDAGDRARERREQRDKGAAIETDAQHQLVHQESGAGHIARRFEKQDESEQDHDLGQEHHDGTNAVDSGVDDEAMQDFIGDKRGNRFLKRRKASFDRIHRGRGPGEHGLEDHEQHGDKNNDTGNGVKQNRIHAARELVHRRLDHRFISDAPGFALEGAEIVNGLGDNSAGRRGFQDFVDLGDQRLAPGLAGCARGDHGHAEHGRELRNVDLHAVALGKIDHVERDDDGQAKRLHLQNSVQVGTQVGSVGDKDQRIRWRLAPFALNGLDRHSLVCRASFETVDAGKVDQCDAGAAGRLEAAIAGLNSRAGIVGRLGDAAGKPVEQCGLPAVGRTNKGQSQCRRGHSASST